MNYFDEAVKSICESIRFESCQQEYSRKYPFGKRVADCLAHFLGLAASLGFETHNYDNYVGEVIFGEGEEEVAVLCHLDVVPAGDGWTKPPFGGVVENGKIWGRGAVDDKGPAICCLYAMKSLKDAGYVPARKIKLIVGCNEENGWGCIEHYNEVAKMPELGFSPDAEFPVIYAEKGILHLRLHFPMKEAPFLFLEGGEQTNMVCSYCESTPRSINANRAEELGLTFENKKLVSRGISAHGSTPELGKDAILPMLRYYEAKSPVIGRIIDCVFNDIYGLRTLKDETGSLTMSPNVIRFRKHQIHLIVDIRYPASMDRKEILYHISKFGVDYEILHDQAPIYHDPQSKLVQSLLEIYGECTGYKHDKPIAIGGGTYARALKNGVGFGPEMPGDIPVIHMADEYITLDRVKLLLEVYEKAIRSISSD